MADNERTDAIQDYIARNTNHTPVRQLFFGEILTATSPEFELTGMPTRTLSQVFGEDFVPTISVIRKIYIPFYDAEEQELLLSAVDWVRKNRNDFDKAGIGDVGYDRIPISVLLFYHTLSFMTAFGDSVGSKDVRECRVPVAFVPGHSDFKKDIRRLTLSEYDKFRLMGLAMNKAANFKKINSSSRFTYLMTRFFWSAGDDEYAIEAADVLTRNIFIGYFLALKSRLRIIDRFLGV